MTRKKVTLAWIANDSARKASLKKRRIGLLKKVRELSTLCGVSAFVIIYSPKDNQPMTWPSSPEVTQMLARFHSTSEIERSKKMTTQETYLKERVGKLQEQIKKQQRKLQELEASNLMHDLYNEGRGLHDLSLSELHLLMCFAQEKHKEVKKRVEFLKQVPPSPGSLDPPAQALALEDSVLVSYQNRTTNFGKNSTDGFGRDQHGKAPSETASWEQGFNNMIKNSGNLAGSSSRSSSTDKNDQVDMAGLSAPHQHFAGSSSGGNQIVGLLAPGSYKNHYFGGSSGSETIMGLQPYKGFRGLSTGATNMSLFLPQPPLSSPHVRGSGAGGGSDAAVGILQPHGGGRGQGNGRNDVGMMLRPQSSLDFEGNGEGSDVAPWLQPYGNIKAGDNGCGSAVGDIRSPRPEFLGGASDARLPYDVAKHWPGNFYP